MREGGLATVGAGIDAEAAAAPPLLEKNGLRLAILNFAENEFGGARRDRPGVASFDTPDNFRRIGRAREIADLVVVATHAGAEHYPFPAPWLRHRLRAMVDAGAAAVFNCHTHCPLGYEIHHGSPIVYSPIDGWRGPAKLSPKSKPCKIPKECYKTRPAPR